MDAGKVFILLLSVLVFGILAYLELKSRRARQDSQPSIPETDQATEKTSGKH